MWVWRCVCVCVCVWVCVRVSKHWNHHRWVCYSVPASSSHSCCKDEKASTFVIQCVSSLVIQTLKFSGKHTCQRHFFTLHIILFICFAVNKAEKLSPLLHCSDSSLLYFQCIMARFTAKTGQPLAAGQLQTGDELSLLFVNVVTFT